MGEVIRVLIVESESLFRGGLKACLSIEQDMRVIGSVATAEDGYRVADEFEVDVLLVGTTLPDGPGLAAAKEFRRRHQSVSVFVMTHHVSDRQLAAAVLAGATAYCGYDMDEETLVGMIRRAVDGEDIITEQVLEKPNIAAKILAQSFSDLISGSAMKHERPKTDEWDIRGRRDARPSTGAPPERTVWYTRRAAKALSYANLEARRLRHDHVGTAHLLAGLLLDRASVAASVLGERGIVYDRVRRALVLTLGGGVTDGPPNQPRTSPRTREAIRVALECAGRLGHAEVGTGHLLAALVTQHEGTAAGILESLGCRLEDLEKRTIELLTQGAVDEPEDDVSGMPAPV